MYYRQLNGFRCLFVFLVLIEHWFPIWVYRTLETGSIGVNLFFVLSGFLIGEALLLEKGRSKDKRQSLYNFYAKRTLRIFPVYYLVILLYALFFSTGGIFWWNITYTTNILECLNPSAIAGEFSHLWSLCVEEQFYLFFPFLVLFLPWRALKTVLLVGIAFAVFFRLGILLFQAPNARSFVSRLLPSCLDCLLGGALLAYAKCRKPEILSRVFANKKNIFLLIGLCLLSMFLFKNAAPDILRFAAFRFFGMWLGILLIGYSVTIGFSGFFGRFLEQRWISYLGKISYGIYLFHPFIRKLYLNYFPTNGLRRLATFVPKLEYNFYIIDFVLLTIFTVAVSALSYELYEKRFLLLKRFFESEKIRVSQSLANQNIQLASSEESVASGL